MNRGASIKNSRMEYRVKKQNVKAGNQGDIKDIGVVEASNSFEILKEDMGLEIPITGRGSSGIVIGQKGGKDDLGEQPIEDKSMQKEDNIKEVHPVKLKSKINSDSGYFKVSSEQFNVVAQYITRKSLPPSDVMRKWNVGQKKLFQEQWDKLMFDRMTSNVEVESEDDKMACDMKEDNVVIENVGDIHVLGIPDEELMS
ncbi:hypothetical protein Hanom_Chr12g01092061 [Helianthus anomalus]